MANTKNLHRILRILHDEDLLDGFGEWYFENYHNLKESNKMTNEWIENEFRGINLKETLEHFYKFFRDYHAETWLLNGDLKKWEEYKKD